MKTRTKIHDNWKTPESLYNELNTEFNFDFDPCPLHWDGAPETDGLEIEWGSRNFINPPYSLRLKTAFVCRAVEMSWGAGKLCVLLLPVSTSTKLFHDVIQPNITEPIRFLRGRVKFEGVNSKGVFVSGKCGMHDSMIVIMDGREKSIDDL